MSARSVSSAATVPAAVLRFAVVGEAGVGKSTFLGRHATGEWNLIYRPTLDPAGKMTSLRFYTNYGLIVVNCVEFGGQLTSNGRQTLVETEGGFNGALAMFDVCSRVSYRAIPAYVASVQADLPVAICGNKVDSRDRKVLAQNITYHRDLQLFRSGSMAYYEVSSKSNYQYERPFMFLIRQVTGRKDLVFVEAPAVAPPVVVKPYAMPQSTSESDDTITITITRPVDGLRSERGLRRF